MNALDVTYRRAATAGASGFGLLIALYDTLAGDLRRAARAQRDGDLEQRAREVKHALSVLAVLENWVEADSGDLARMLTRFYRRLRNGMIQAQCSQSPELFEKLMGEILGIRELWQKMEEKGAYIEPQILPPTGASGPANAFSIKSEPRHIGWSA